MNYNKDKQENIEVDDMKIKSHLNASLDLSGISVSEDLINRTLEAIKKQTLEQQVTEDSETAKEEQKKVIPWNRYIRTFAGVAAAAIVVVAGYGIINAGLIGSKKSANSTEMTALDRTFDAATESAADSTMSAVPDSAADTTITATTDTIGTEDAAAASEESVASSLQESTTEAPLFTITADTDLAAADAGEGTTGYAGETVVGATAPMLKGTDSENVLAFRDIFLADPALAKSITIADNINQTSVTLTSEAEVLDFYTVMDQQQFSYAAEATASPDYTIEITAAPDDALYTMKIGEHITVDYSGGGTASQSLYDALDIEALKLSLIDLLTKYSR